MTIDELIATAGALSRTVRLHMMQAVLQQLAQEEPASAQPARPSAEPFDPQPFYGAAQHSRQAVDHYLALAREGWN